MSFLLFLVPKALFLIDNIEKPLTSIGLNGRAVIPLILGFGCVTMATITTRLLGSLQGKIETVLVHGKIVVQEGTFVGDLKEGQFLSRQRRN